MPPILPKFTYVKRSGDALTPLGAFVCLFVMSIDLFYVYALASQLKAAQETMYSLPSHIISMTALIGFVLAGYISLPLRGLLTCTLVGSTIPVLICGIVLTTGAASIDSCSYGLAAFVGIALGIRIPGVLVYALDVSRSRLGTRAGFLVAGYLFSFCFALIQQAFLYQAIGASTLNSATSTSTAAELTTLYKKVASEHISYLTLAYGIMLSLGSMVFIISSIPHKPDPKTGDYKPHTEKQKVVTFRALSSAVAAPVVTSMHITSVKIGDDFVINSACTTATSSPKTACSTAIKTPLDAVQAEATPHVVLADTHNGSLMFAVQSVNTMKNMTFAAYETSFNNSGCDVRHNGIRTLGIFNKSVHHTLGYQIAALVFLFLSLEIIFATLAYVQYNSIVLGHLRTIFMRLVPDLTKYSGFSNAATSQPQTAQKRLYIENLFVLAIWCGTACFIMLAFSLVGGFMTPLFVSYRQRLLESPIRRKLAYTLILPIFLALLLLNLPNLLVGFFCGTIDCPKYDTPIAIYIVLVCSIAGGLCILFPIALCTVHLYNLTEQLHRKFSRPVIRLMALPLLINPFVSRLLVFDLSRVSYFNVAYTDLRNDSTKQVLVLVGTLLTLSAVTLIIGLVLMILGKAHEQTVEVDFDKIGITVATRIPPHRGASSKSKSRSKAAGEDEILQELPKPFSRVLLEPPSPDEVHTMDMHRTGVDDHCPNKTESTDPAASYAENLGKSTYQVENVCDVSGPTSPATISPLRGQQMEPRDSIADP